MLQNARPLVLLPAAIATLALTSPAASAQAVRLDANTLLRRVESTLTARESELIAFRHDLHRHPETSGNEVRTAAAVASRLRAAGLTVRTGVGGHGVVAELRGGRPGPTVAYRADMDAVLSSDPDPVDYRSATPGVRHVCGHDVHTAIAVALAEALAAARADLPGSVVFLFQPAEERGTGARAMLADGAIARPGPTAIFALHTAPMVVGQLSTSTGAMMPGRDAIRVVLRGQGDLRAAADSVRRMILSYGTISQAEAFRPAAPDFVLAEAGRGQGAGDSVVLGAMLTMASAANRERIATTLPRSLRGLRFEGVAISATHQQRTIPGVTNDSAVAARAMRAIAAALGDSVIGTSRDVIPAFSEDFGAFQEQIPGAFFFLGVSNPAKGTRGMPHTPDYVADDSAIRFGARAMAAVILDRLHQTR